VIAAVAVTLWMTLLVASFALLRWVSQERARPEPLITWRIVVPRGAHFGIPQATAWFKALRSLVTDPKITPSLELAARQGQLQLSFTAPVAWERTVRAQLAAWFPDARLERVAADHPAGVLTIQPLRLAKPEIHPIGVMHTEKQAVDPLLGIAGALTHLQSDCGLRLTVRPEPGDWRDWASEAITALRSGSPILPRHWPAWVRFLAERFPTAWNPWAIRGEAPSLATLAAASAKASEPVLEASIIAWCRSANRETARRQLQALTIQITAAFHDSQGNRIVTASAPVVGSDDSSHTADGRWEVYSGAELAYLFHLPNASHPLIPTEIARRVSPGLDVLAHSPAGKERTWLGEALTNEGPRAFGINQAQRRLHLYVVGKTGAGKSTFLAHLAQQELAAGRSLGLIDPHGDLAEHVLSLVPPERHEQVLYFNAADPAYPVGFNLLSVASPERRPLVASGVVGVFKKLYGDSWGPRLEHFLRNSILALLETPSPSLLLLPRLLTDKAFRHRLLQHVQDPLLRTFFFEEYDRYDPRWRAEAISPILNKVGQFLASPIVRHLVGQAGPGFNLRQLMDRGEIFIANLASGRIGEDNSDLLGGLLVAGFQLAAMSRADQPEAERRDFSLLVDEFQHFANDAFAGILSEARKYRLSLTLSHQYLDQVPPGITEAVLGNVGSLIVFRVGGGDVARLVRELTPTFDGQDLVHLPNYQFCARLAGPRGVLPAFSGQTVPVSAGTSDLTPLIERSRRRWSRPRAEVELEIADLWEGHTE